MKSHEAMPHQVDKDIVAATSADGTHTRTIGLISLLTDQPGLYRPNAFGGAKIDDPWITARKYVNVLEKQDKVDLVVPLCHLYEPQDEKTCREFNFPVVISGHDHHTVDRMIEGSRLIKAGSDGHKAAIIDITWATSDTKDPTVNVQLVTVADWPPDQELQKEVHECLSVLDALRNTQLAVIPKEFRPLDSMGVRGAVKTAATFLCGEYLKAFNADMTTPFADCVLMPGGNVRGGRLYNADDFFSLESLKSEIHPKMNIGVVKIPGHILCETIRDSHSRGSHPYFMQYDAGVIVDPHTHMVTHIGGAPLDSAKMYNVGYPIDELKAENGPACWLEYQLQNPPNERHLHSTARGGQEFLLQHWAHQIWLAVWQKLDANNDGKVSRDEYRALDSNNDGKVDQQELIEFMHQELGYAVDSGEVHFASHVLKIAGDANNDKILTWKEFHKMEEKRK